MRPAHHLPAGHFKDEVAKAQVGQDELAQLGQQRERSLVNEAHTQRLGSLGVGDVG